MKLYIYIYMLMIQVDYDDPFYPQWFHEMIQGPVAKVTTTSNGFHTRLHFSHLQIWKSASNNELWSMCER